MSHQELLNSNFEEFDKQHVIHPYGFINNPQEYFPEVKSCKGNRLYFANNTSAIDGLSSWWACIHGYRRKELDDAIVNQVQNKMSHVMFGGLTHRPACELVAKILDIVPTCDDYERKLSKVFLCDSGSIAVEVAMKVAIQHKWKEGNEVIKDKFVTTYSGYHGDTFLPMSVSDPISGMHQLFQGVIAQQLFVSAPNCHLNQCDENKCHCKTLSELENVFKQSSSRIAAFIIEPLFQGAGAMNFYSPSLLVSIRKLCDEFDIPLIIDEIATGFGRTGTLFACEQAKIVPDILCIGKGLTGGYVTMGATILSNRITKNVTYPLMHGPTFMANPLACAVAIASIDLLLSSPWKLRVSKIESLLKVFLLPILNKYSSIVSDVRVFGAIGVIEFKQSLSSKQKQKMTQVLLENQVWLRPFSKFLYTMPPFNAPMTDEDIQQICLGMEKACEVLMNMQEEEHQESKRSKTDITFV